MSQTKPKINPQVVAFLHECKAFAAKAASEMPWVRKPKPGDPVSENAIFLAWTAWLTSTQEAAPEILDDANADELLALIDGFRGSFFAAADLAYGSEMKKTAIDHAALAYAEAMADEF